MLYNWHVQAGARMVEFAGWDMPLSYTTIRQEHETVRTKAGLFDLSHMGRLRIHGPDRTRFVQYVFTNNINNLAEGGIHYGFLCNPQGGVIDDITVYAMEEYYLLVVNGVNTAKVFNWLRMNATDFKVEIEDATLSLSMLAIQGPASQEIMNLVGEDDFSAVKNYHFTIRQVHRYRCVLSRTGYTGEDGFEIYIPAMSLIPLWERFISEGRKFGLVPVGLGARDTLRTEACMPLYGNELTDVTTPLEAGLGRFVDLSKPDFIGKKALTLSRDAEFSRNLIAFVMEDNAIPRHGQKVLLGDMEIGVVTSGTFSPFFKKGIGMAWADHSVSHAETSLNIMINDKPHPAVLKKKPLYKRRKQ